MKTPKPDRRTDLDEFIAATAENTTQACVLEIELLSGCANCAAILLENGNFVKPGTVSITVLDEKKDEILAKYALCERCAAESIR